MDWLALIVVAGVILEFAVLLAGSWTLARRDKALLLLANVLIAGGVGGEYMQGFREAATAHEAESASARTIAALKSQEAADQKIASQAAAYAADLGVTVEVIRDYVTWKQADAESQLANFKRDIEGERNRNAAAVSALQASMADLNTVRDRAQAATASIKSDLAEMTSLLDQERALRQQMTAAMTPRGFSPDQQEAARQKLEIFGPMRVDIITFGDSREIVNFGRELAETLQVAGWRPRVWAAFNGAAYNFTGVPIMARAGLAKAQKAAATLQAVLAGQQIAVRNGQTFSGTTLPFTVTGPSWNEADVGDVRILIGPKPPVNEMRAAIKPQEMD